VNAVSEVRVRVGTIERVSERSERGVDHRVTVRSWVIIERARDERHERRRRSCERRMSEVERRRRDTAFQRKGASLLL
jgi:hypothetical protein